MIHLRELVQTILLILLLFCASCVPQDVKPVDGGSLHYINVKGASAFEVVDFEYEGVRYRCFGRSNQLGCVKL